MPKLVTQIAGFLKMKLFGQSSGMDVPLAADGDGHLQVDIASATVNATVEQVTVQGHDGAQDRKVHVDTEGDLQIDVLSQPDLTITSMPTLTVQFSIGTAIPSEINPDDAGNAGTSSLAAKEDHVHGFPCGTPGTTTLGEASAEGDAASAARSDHKHNFIRTGLADVRLTRSSAMQLSLGGLVGTSKRIEINGEYLDCSTTETVNTTDNVIAADSTDSGAAAAADTNYYVYASNSQASYAPSSIRLCTQAPDANGYLGSGNAAHWRLVGWAGTDSSTQFPENGFVISRFNMKSDRIMSTFSPPGSWYYPSTAYTWEDIGVSESFLWPPGMAVFIYFNATTFHQEAGCMNAVRIRLDQKGEASAGAFLSEAYVNARVNHVGGHYSRNTGALVRETLYVQAYTTKVTPTNGAFYKANDFTNFIVIFIPEELT